MSSSFGADSLCLFNIFDWFQSMFVWIVSLFFSMASIYSMIHPWFINHHADPVLVPKMIWPICYPLVVLNPGMLAMDQHIVQMGGSTTQFHHTNHPFSSMNFPCINVNHLKSFINGLLSSIIVMWNYRGVSFQVAPSSRRWGASALVLEPFDHDHPSAPVRYREIRWGRSQTWSCKGKLLFIWYCIGLSLSLYIYMYNVYMYM